MEVFDPIGIPFPQSPNRPLSDVIKLKGPFGLNNAPNAYSFQRSRLLEVNWEEVLSKIYPDLENELEKEQIEQWKNIFTSNWGGQPDLEECIYKIDLNPNPTADQPKNRSYAAWVHNPEAVRSTKSITTIWFKLFVKDQKLREFTLPPKAYDSSPGIRDGTIRVAGGCALKFVPVGSREPKYYRFYQPVEILSDGTVRAIEKSDFIASWDNAWARTSALFSVYVAHIIIENGKAKRPDDELALNQAMENFQAAETIRADAALIKRQWKRVETEIEIASELSKRAVELGKTFSGADLSVIEQIAEQYRKLKRAGEKADFLKQQLADAASDLGYYLAIGQEESVIHYDDKGKEKTQKLVAGDLYLVKRTTVNWITYHSVTKKKKGLISSKSTTYQVPINNSKTFDYYQEVKVDFDPWIEASDCYHVAGYEVYLFRETPDGLRSADGQSVEQVLQHCRDDEQFRINCAIAIPLYEFTIIGEQLLVGYEFIFRPLPELAVVDFPELSVAESLSYRFVWNGSFVDELAASIPLSPGEEREVSIQTTQKFESSRTQTASSLLEVSRLDRSDFETVFEREVRSETERTSEISGSVTGSYKGAKGKLGGSKGKKTNEVARELNRAVRRASQEINRKQREEISVTVTEKSEITQSNSVSYKIKNINQGATLNVAFFRLMNEYQGQLALDDYGINVVAGANIASSIDYRESRTFKREDYASIVEYLLNGRFPIVLDRNQAEELKVSLQTYMTELIARDYLASVLTAEQTAASKKALTKLLNDYGSNPDALRHIRNQSGSSFLVPEILASNFRSDAKINSYAKKRLLQEVLSSDARDQKDMFGLKAEPENFAADSGALYADVQLGLMPATEQYSNDMRELEKQARSADVRLINSRATYLQSKAFKTAGFDPYATAVSVIYNYDDKGHPALFVRIVPRFMDSGGWIARILGIGEYPQQKSEDIGTLAFLLPVEAEKTHDIGGWSESDFETKLNFFNPDLNQTIPYKKTLT